jgi:hypothetical protein
VEARVDHRLAGLRLPERIRGDIVTELKKGRRITGNERDTVAKDLRKQYEDGASIRALAEQTGRSYGFVHGVLVDAGAAMRGRGGSSSTTSKGSA